MSSVQNGSGFQAECYQRDDTRQHHTKLWTSRDLRYKLGTVVFMFSSGLYFVSVVSHPWFEIHEWDLYAVSPVVEWSLINELPNKFCTLNSECIESTVSRVLFFICLGGYALSYIIMGTENCRRVDSRVYHSRKLEATMLLTVVNGALGLVFVRLFKQGMRLPLTTCWPEYLIRVSLALLFIGMALCSLGNGKKLAGTVVSDSAHRPHHTAPASTQYNHPTQAHHVTVLQHGQVPQAGSAVAMMYAQPPPKYTATAAEDDQCQAPGPIPPPQYQVGPSAQPMMFPQPVGPPPPYAYPPAYPASALQSAAESNHPLLQMESSPKPNTD